MVELIGFYKKSFGKIKKKIYTVCVMHVKL
jgi:hypothetical protein